VVGEVGDEEAARMRSVKECLKMGCWTVIKSFHVKIILLDKQELIQEIQGKTTGQDLLDNIYKYLNLIETAYFGLRYQDNANQTHWLDPAKRVSQQIKGVSPITLYLGVKFYAADPCKLVEEITRYQFFLQVKLDILQGRLPVPQELATELAALALQSELGDYSPSRHSPGYVSEFRFHSAQTEEVEQAVEVAHGRLVGLVPSQAENRYLEKVKWLDMYGVDLHPVIGEDNIEYFLGLTPSGIIVLKNRNKVGNYFWPRISKIYFKGKYFMLRVRDKNNDENTYGFETPSRQACKHLWKCCVEHHAFFRLVQVSPATAGTTSGVFGLGSKFRYSGRTEKELSQELGNGEIRRNPPHFTRVPSQRFSRRSRSEEGEKRRGGSTLERKETGLSHGSLASRHLSASNVYTASPRGTSLPRNSGMHPAVLQSLPPNVGADGERSFVADGDMSLQSLQYLESRGLFGSRESRSRRGSESHEGGEGERRRRVSRRGGSDDESEVSAHSMSSHRGRGRGERGDHSGSESESSRGARKNHRGRRKRSGSYKLVETDEQWKEVQRQQGRGKGGVQEATVRKSGYINSGAETESELVTTLRRNKRRQRSRSRSPSEARARLPHELTKHFELGLVEPGQDKEEIPYTAVTTERPVNVRYGSGRRSRHSSGGASRRRNAVEEERRETASLQHQPQNYPSYSEGHASTPYQSFTPQQAQVSTVETLRGSQASLAPSLPSSHPSLPGTPSHSHPSLPNSSSYSQPVMTSTPAHPSLPPSSSRPSLPPHPHPSHQAFPSPGLTYTAVNPSIGSLLSSSPHSLQAHPHPHSSHHLPPHLSHSLHNGHPPPATSSSPRNQPSLGQDGFSGLPPLPATGLASLPSYAPVYSATPPQARHGSRPPPPPPTSYPLPGSPLRPPPSRHTPQVQTDAVFSLSRTCLPEFAF